MSAELNVHTETSSKLKEAAESSKNEKFSFVTYPESYFRDPKDTCIEVNMNVVVLNLCDIDTLNQSYSMKAELWVAWPLLKEEVISYCKNPNDFKPGIHPRPSPWTISIDTQEFMIFPSDRTIQVFAYEGKVMACECTLISARFLESLELESFPFDCQHLCFHVALRSDCDMPMRVTESGELQGKDVRAVDGFMNFDGRAMMAMKLKQDACCFNVRSQYLSISDFDLHNIEAEIENMPDDIPFLHCAMRLSRNWRPYIYRVFLTMYFVMCAACTVFRFPTDGIQDRLSFTATMLLTAVAFLFIVGDWLPRLKYLTLIDKYMLVSFAFITCLALQVTIADAVNITESQETALMWANLAACTAGHLGLMYRCWQVRTFELSKITKTRREVDSAYEGKESGTSKDQFIVHTGVSRSVTTNSITVYTGSLRDSTLGWMMPKKKV